MGGTNPSLLEAMGGYCLIYAHENEFNKLILGEEGTYFSTVDEIVEILKNEPRKKMDHPYLAKNLNKIKTIYVWENIAQAYENLFKDLINEKIPKPNYFTTH